MSSLYEHIGDADWHYMTDEQVDTVLAGARDAFRSCRGLVVETLDDFEQDALLYAATHKKTITGMHTFSGLRSHIRQRLVENGRRGWEKDRSQDLFGNPEEVGLS